MFLEDETLSTRLIQLSFKWHEKIILKGSAGMKTL